MISDRIIKYARECIGTPFMHQGRVVGIGLDCAGVVAHALSRAGIVYSDVKGYTRTPFRGLLQETLERQSCLLRVAIAEKSAGDILLMRFMGEPQHVAVYSGMTIIHGYFGSGKVVEHPLDSKWLRRISGVYRVIE